MLDPVCDNDCPDEVADADYVKITANTAAKNVDIMFSLMSWLMCRYLLLWAAFKAG
jgi:hypothetical protein